MHPSFSTFFSPQDRQALSPALKIGVLATVNDAGLPHLTLISSLTSLGEKEVTWGQFTEGMSKTNVRSRAETAFLIMTLNRNVWRGIARWRESKKGGPEFEAYNNQPMFRYNAYFGIHTVHYMDLIGQTGGSPLPMNTIIASAITTILARPFLRKSASPACFNPWTTRFLGQLDCLKFLAYVRPDGFPWIVPVIQAQPAGGSNMMFAGFPYSKELAEIPDGQPVALLGLSLQMEDVLLRGDFSGAKSFAGIPVGRMAVDWVYNPMPPAPRQVFPHLPVQAVTEF
jgi:hypothetical protein